MKPINPHFLMARRRADHDAARFGHSNLDYPAIARKGKTLPVDLDTPMIPECEELPPIPGWNWDTAILAVCALAATALLFIEV